jgi:ComF family protein
LTAIKNYIDDFLHLFFPHVCAGCDNDVLNTDDELCAACLNSLPETGFLSTQNNPVEKIFYGRIKIHNAGSAFYFNKDSVIQELIIQLKYRNNKNAGKFLGKLLGQRLLESKRFDDVDVIVALPLNDKKLYKRGYNQSLAIVEGITSVWNKKVAENAVGRILFTETQTQKDRIARWRTMENVFEVYDASLLENKHVLLVDDVVTTGATLEACSSAILKVPGVKLSLATVAYTI